MFSNEELLTKFSLILKLPTSLGKKAGRQPAQGHRDLQSPWDISCADFAQHGHFQTPIVSGQNPIC